MQKICHLNLYKKIIKFNFEPFSVIIKVIKWGGVKSTIDYSILTFGLKKFLSKYALSSAIMISLGISFYNKINNKYTYESGKVLINLKLSHTT